MARTFDGVPVDNEAFGWLLLDDSEPNASTTIVRDTYQAAGRDGSGASRGYADVPTITLVIETPTDNLEALRVLIKNSALYGDTDDPTVAATYELLSFVPETIIGQDYVADFVPPTGGYGNGGYGD